MALLSLKPKQFLRNFLQILNKPALFPAQLAEFCVFLSFLQLLSYVFKLEGLESPDSRGLILQSLIFYANFSHFLSFVGSDSLTLVAIFLTFACLLGFFLYWFLRTWLNFSRNRRFLRENALIFVEKAALWGISLYDRVFLTPCLELFVTIFSENSWKYLKNPGNLQNLLYFCSICGISLAVTLGFLVLWLFRSHEFSEKNGFRGNFSVFLLISFICRLFLVLSFEFFPGNLVYFLLIAISALNLLDFFANFPISHEKTSRNRLIFLSNFLLFSLFFAYLGLLREPLQSNDVYLLSFLAIFVTKLAISLHKWLYLRKILMFSHAQPEIRSIEEFLRFSLEKTRCERSTFLYFCFIKRHSRECRFKDCALRQISKETQRLDPKAQENLTKRLISELFLEKISGLKKESAKTAANSSKVEENEPILLKYISFCAKSSFSQLKALFEILNIVSFASNCAKNRSFFFEETAKQHLQALRAALRTFEAEKASDFDDKEISLEHFFEMLREKRRYQQQMSHILAGKLAFWELYGQGFQSYESVIAKSYVFLDELRSFQAELRQSLRLAASGRQSQQKLIFSLKFSSIFSCVLLNNLNEGVQFEDRLDKILKRELTLEQNILNCHSFFNENVVVLQASFLKFDGKLLESCKNQKVADFFGFSLQELKEIRDIRTFMPKILAEAHESLVSEYVNRVSSTKTQRKREKIAIESFVLEKNGCVSKAKVYFCKNFSGFDDLRFDAAIMRLGFEGDLAALVDRDGVLQGISQGFLNILANSQENPKENPLNPKDLVEILNIFAVISDLEPIFQAELAKTKGNEEKVAKVAKSANFLRNLAFVMRVPRNLREILRVLQEKRREEQSEMSHNSYRSGKSLKENPKNLPSATTKTSKFLSLFFSTMKMTETDHSRTIFEEKHAKKQLNSLEVLRKMLEKQPISAFRATFSLNFQNLRVKDREIALISLSFHKIAKIPEKSLYELGYNSSNLLENGSNPAKSEEIGEISYDIHEEPEISLPPVNNLALFSSKEEEKSRKSENISIEIQENANNRLFTTEADQEMLIESRRNPENLDAPRFFSDKPRVSEEKLKQISKKEGSSEISQEFEEVCKDFSLEKHKKTSLQKIYDFVDRSSKTSSLSSLKKTFSIFNLIKLIQGFSPYNIRNFTVLQTVEFVVILAFCIVIYQYCLMFIENYYKPLQSSLENYANIFTYYCSANLISLDLFLYKRNLLDFNGFSAYNQEYKSILDRNFREFKAKFVEERTKATNFNFQTIVLNDMMNVMDLERNQSIAILFDEFLGKIQNIIYSLKEDDLANTNDNIVEYMSLNFNEFNQFYSQISAEIEKEFVFYNESIAKQVQDIMIGLICMVFVVKILQITQILGLSSRFTKLLNIFLRINANEAYNEGLLTKEILESLQDPYDRFLNVDYPDKVLNKKTVILAGDEQILSNISNNSNNPGKKTKKKKKNTQTSKKFSLHSLKNLSKLPLILYILISFSLVFAYLFFNFYFAEVITKEKINNLINIAGFFENLFTAPSTLFADVKILYYDKLFPKGIYQVSRENFQLKLHEDLWNQVDYIELINKELPLYAYNQAQSLGDDLVSTILNGNICEILKQHQLITEQEGKICNTNLNGAFTKGIVNVISMIISDSHNQKELISLVYNSTVANIQAQNQELQAYLTGLGWNDSRSLTNYLYSKAANVIFQRLNQYYTNQINEQFVTMEKVLLSTSILILLLYLFLIYAGHKFLTKIHNNITTLLSLIPFEKLINDEQTSFLIKKIWRE